MKNIQKKGQALISLIGFIAISSAITSAAISVAIITSRSGENYSTGNMALAVAQTGAENAVLRLLRDGAYAGETMNINTDSVTINVSGTNPKTITATSAVGSYKRKIEVIGTYSNNVFTITSWKEVN